MATSINTQEIEHFAKDSSQWWDENGPFKPLHRLNPVRISYIRERIEQHFGLEQGLREPFKGLKVLDVGCGGGIVCEPMARLGAKVTGLDADANAIKTAKTHAKQSKLAIDYQNKALENFKDKHDVVLSLEIIEHVDNVDEFVQSCVDICKPGGLIIFSTLNRTPKSYALGIVAAEYILRWVPQGTHSWKKFIKPSELSHMVRASKARTVDIKGLSFKPVADEFELSGDVSINYFLTAVKA